MMQYIPGLIIIGCWIVFIVYWIVSALRVKATKERKSFVSSLPYRIPLIIGGVLIAKFRVPYPLDIPLTPFNFYTYWFGPVVCVAGLCIAIWSRWTLAGNWSSNVQFKEGHKLITTGPYRFVRHPIYTGILLMCSAPAIQFGRLHCWLGLLIVGIGLWIKLKQEESIMLQHFPEYTGYCKHVKALVPFVI